MDWLVFLKVLFFATAGTVAGLYVPRFGLVWLIISIAKDGLNDYVLAYGASLAMASLFRDLSDENNISEIRELLKKVLEKLEKKEVK